MRILGWIVCLRTGVGVDFAGEVWIIPVSCRGSDLHADGPLDF